MDNLDNKLEKFVSPKHFEPVLMPIISELSASGAICFLTEGAVASEDGHNWIPKSEKTRENFQTLQTLTRENPDFAVALSRKISLDYQKVIEKFLENPENKRKVEPLFSGGKKWTLEKIDPDNGETGWSKCLIESAEIGITREDIEKIQSDLIKKIKEKGEDFFGYFEGNVIGDHIWIKKDESKPLGERKVILLGTRVVPRAGKNCYDFIRALDWMFLKAFQTEDEYKKISGYLGAYAEKYGIDKEEMKLVAATRFIGIGWDMLGRTDPRPDRGEGDQATKLKWLARFIQMRDVI